MIWSVGVLSAFLLAGLSVLLHFECLSRLHRYVGHLASDRARVITTMIGLLAAHVAEIWLYAGAYFVLTGFPEFGAIQSETDGQTLLDLVYYSAMVYTTVGFGDMIPSGGIRLITATEALVGLSLIAWSASFTYFQFQDRFSTSKT